MASKNCEPSRCGFLSGRNVRYDAAPMKRSHDSGAATAESATAPGLSRPRATPLASRPRSPTRRPLLHAELARHAAPVGARAARAADERAAATVTSSRDATAYGARRRLIETTAVRGGARGRLFVNSRPSRPVRCTSWHGCQGCRLLCARSSDALAGFRPTSRGGYRGRSARPRGERDRRPDVGRLDRHRASARARPRDRLPRRWPARLDADPAPDQRLEGGSGGRRGRDHDAPGR